MDKTILVFILIKQDVCKIFSYLVLKIGLSYIFFQKQLKLVIIILLKYT